jgi:hypothetical protein
MMCGFAVMPLIIQTFENQKSSQSMFQTCWSFVEGEFVDWRLPWESRLPSRNCNLLFATVHNLERFFKQGLATLLLIVNFGVCES